jgi:hypothetical protein
MEPTTQESQMPTKMSNSFLYTMSSVAVGFVIFSIYCLAVFSPVLG